MRTHASKNHGFSLLELLVVILIIGIIAAFVTPAATTILKGSQLSQAEQILTDQIKLARQQAVTKNHNIEVRFIRYGDPEMPGEKANTPSSGFFRAIQVMEVLDSGAVVPLDKPQLLPQSIIVSPSTLSTLVSHPDMQPVKQAKKQKASDGSGGDPGLPRGIDWNYEYVSFRFLPDGGTSLNSTNGVIWCITLHDHTAQPQGSVPPPNFVTLQLDPVAGSVRLFRPSV
jgi:uncharacterized protein (TIGR02596 family)